MATIAQYDNEGVYIGTTDDFGQGLPRNCCYDIPVKIDRDKTPEDEPGWYNGYWPQMTSTKCKWEYPEDHRGETWYDKSERVVITKLGSIPKHYTEHPVLDDEQIAETLQLLRQQKYMEVDSVRATMFDAGVWYKGHLFQSRQKDRDVIKSTLDLVNQVGWVLGDNYTWRSAKDIMVPFNHQDLFMLNLYLIIQNEIVYNIGWNDKDNVLDKMTSKNKIKNFKPTYLTSSEIQEKIEERIKPFQPLLLGIIQSIGNANNELEEKQKELLDEMNKE